MRTIPRLCAVGLLLLVPVMVQSAFADGAADLKRAEEFQKNGEFAEAEALLTQVVAQNNGTTEALQAYRMLAVGHVKRGQDDQAQAILGQLTADYAQHEALPEAVYFMAKNFNWKNKHGKAVEIHRYNAENFSHDKYAMWSQVELVYHHIRGGEEEAGVAGVNRLLTAFTQQPTLAEEVCNVGHKYQDTGDYAKAIQLYEHLIGTWPRASNVLFARAGLAISYSLVEDQKAASAAYDRLLSDLRQGDATPEQVYWTAKRFNWAKQDGKAAEIHRYNTEKSPDAKHVMWSQVELAYHLISLTWPGTSITLPNAATMLAGRKRLDSCTSMWSPSGRRPMTSTNACQWLRPLLA